MTAPTNLPYCRASSDPRDTFSSVKVQEQRGLQVGDLNGWRNLTPIIDNDRSAATGSKRRPGFEKVKDMVASKRVDFVTVFSLSRATRDVEEFNALLRMLKGTATKLCVNGRIVDPNNPHDVLQARNENNYDAYFIDMLKVNVGAAMDSNAKNGMPHGPTPFGYLRVYDERTRRVTTQIPHPQEADEFRTHARNLLAGRTTLSAIAKDMGRSIQAVKVMLVNPAYIGIRMHKGVAYPAVWDGLISEDEHRAIVALIEAAKRGPLSTPARKYPYTGVLYCGLCADDEKQAKLTNRNATKADRFRRYHCHTCGRLSARADELDSYIEERMQRAIGKLSTGSTDGEDAELLALRRKRDRLVAKGQEIRDDYKADVTTRAEFVEFRDDNDEKLAVVERAITDASPDLHLDAFIGREVAEMTDDEKHTAAARMIESVTVWPGGRGKQVPVKERARILWRSVAGLTEGGE